MKIVLKFIIYVTIFYIIIILIGNVIGGIPKGSNEYSSYQLDDEHKSLPYSIVSSTKGKFPELSGSLTVEIQDNFEKPALYIPYYQGNLDVWINGKQVKISDNTARRPYGVFYLRDYFVELDRSSSRKSLNLEFMLTSPGDIRETTFLTLSNMYVAELAAVKKISNMKSIYYDIFRPALIFSLLVTASLLFMLIYFDALGPSAVPLVSFIIFLAVLFSGSLTFIWGGFSVVNQYSFSFGLFGSAILNFYVSTLTHRGASKRDYFYCAAAFIQALFVLGKYFTSTNTFNLTSINASFNLPLLLAGMFFVVVRTLYLAINGAGSKFLLLSAVIFVWMLTLINGALGRFGFVDITVNLPALSMLLLYFVMGYIFAAELVAAKNVLALKNVEMTEALAHQEKQQLQIQFKETEKLKEQEVMRRNYERIYNDLHDGVLTYLFSIKTLANKISDSRAERIGSMSQFCLNEIRIILSSGVSGVAPLILSLASFRHHIFDTLTDRGIDTHWDVKSLIELPPSDLAFNLEIVRVIQEAVNNAVERSGCTNLSVIASLNGNDRLLFVIQNGGGITLSENCGSGLGLKSMEARIIRLGGKFTIQPTKSGATLSFIVPLPQVNRSHF
jgi:signal transduction histidine kinase